MIPYRTNRFLLAVLAAILILSLGLSACQPKPDDVTLKFVVLPILDSLPLFVAEQEGYFAAHGVKVELIPVGAGGERDQLISSGQADGMINEILTTILQNRESGQVQIVRTARAATATDPLFSILASQNSGITGVQDLKNVPVAISEGTVIAYLTDRLLAEQGLTPAEIQTVAVPKISDRMALLASGELKAAMLPEPLATMVQQQGAVMVLNDTVHPELSLSTVAFRNQFLEAHPQAVKAFLAAMEDAVKAINEGNKDYSTLLGEKNLVPKPLLASYQLPPYITASVPTREQYDDVLAWAKEKELLDQDVSYETCVNSSYLP